MSANCLHPFSLFLGETDNFHLLPFQLHFNDPLSYWVLHFDVINNNFLKHLVNSGLAGALLSKKSRSQRADPLSASLIGPWISCHSRGLLANSLWGCVFRMATQTRGGVTFTCDCHSCISVTWMASCVWLKSFALFGLQLGISDPQSLENKAIKRWN